MIAALLVALLSSSPDAPPVSEEASSACKVARAEWSREHHAGFPATNDPGFLNFVIAAHRTAETRHDLNCDGQIQFEEWWDRGWAALTWLDSDRDGRVSRAEYLGYFCKADQPAAVQRRCVGLMRRDFRRSAGSSRAEFIDRDGFRARARTEFLRLDRNRDGVLTRAAPGERFGFE